LKTVSTSNAFENFSFGHFRIVGCVHLTVDTKRSWICSGTLSWINYWKLEIAFSQ